MHDPTFHRRLVAAYCNNVTAESSTVSVQVAKCQTTEGIVEMTDDTVLHDRQN